MAAAPKRVRPSLLVVGSTLSTRNQASNAHCNDVTNGVASIYCLQDASAGTLNAATGHAGVVTVDNRFAKDPRQTGLSAADPTESDAVANKLSKFCWEWKDSPQL